MPNTKSAEKALRQSKRRKKYNLQRKISFKASVKNIQKLISENSLEEARKAIPDAYKALDKAAKANTITKNTSSRKKSRLMVLLNKAAHK